MKEILFSWFFTARKTDTGKKTSFLRSNSLHIAKLRFKLKRTDVESGS